MARTDLAAYQRGRNGELLELFHPGAVYSVFGKSLDYSGNSVIVIGEIGIPAEQYSVHAAKITTIGK